MSKDYRHSKDGWYDDEEGSAYRKDRKQKFKDIAHRRKHKIRNKEESSDE